MKRLALVVGLAASLLSAGAAGPVSSAVPTDGLAGGVSSAIATDEPAPGSAAVELVTVNGSGCPAGQGSATLSEDLTTLSLTAPAYQARAGGTAGPTDFRKNCQLNVKVNQPADWTYAVIAVESAGFADLAAGARGLSRIAIYLQGMSANVLSSEPFVGPFTEDWATTGPIDVASRIFAPCDAQRNLNVNTELRVSVGASNRLVTSLLERNGDTVLRLAWKQCPTR
jgi:hypothetical protein